MNHEIEKFEYIILMGEFLDKGHMGDRNVEIGILLSTL